MMQNSNFMGSDELLSCFIYILVKASAHELPALLTMIEYFTLEQQVDDEGLKQDDLDFVSTTFNAAIQFVRTELVKLCEPTLHYTYIDGKSYLGERFSPSTGGCRMSGRMRSNSPNEHMIDILAESPFPLPRLRRLSYNSTEEEYMSQDSSSDSGISPGHRSALPNCQSNKAKDMTNAITLPWNGTQTRDRSKT